MISISFAAFVPGNAGNDNDKITLGYSGGDGTSGSPYQISNEADLQALADNVNAGNNMTGVYFVMTHDIAIAAASWIPIGKDEAHPFRGVFDGNGRTISGMTVIDINTVVLNSVGDETAFAGLFGYIGNGGTVKNVITDASCSVSVIVADSDDTKKMFIYAGGIAGFNSGTILNCSNAADVEILYTNTYTGALIDMENYSLAGGIVGCNWEPGSVDGCVNSGTVKASSDGGDTHVMESRAGGITAWNRSFVQNCSNSGSVEAQAVSSSDNVEKIGVFSRAGGIVGHNDNAGEVLDSYNTGSVSSTAIVANYPLPPSPAVAPPRAECCAGGIVAYNDLNSLIKRCGNTGSVNGVTGPEGSVTLNKWSTAFLHAGGACGYSVGIIEDCYNNGNITALGENIVQELLAAGGVVGRMDHPAAVTRNCFNTGNVSAVQIGLSTWSISVGGVVGCIFDGMLENSYNKGSLKLEANSTLSNVGGVVGSVLFDADVIEGHWFDGADYELNGASVPGGIGFFGSGWAGTIDTYPFDETILDDLLNALNAFVAGKDLEGWIIVSDINDGFPIFGSMVVTVTVIADDGKEFSYEVKVGGTVIRTGNITIASGKGIINNIPRGSELVITAGGIATWTAPGMESKAPSNIFQYLANGDLEVTVVFISDGAGPGGNGVPDDGKTFDIIWLIPLLIALAALLFVLFWWMRPRVLGVVRFKGEGLANARMEYMIKEKDSDEEPSVKHVMTSHSGKYRIVVPKGAEFTFVSAKKDGRQVAEFVFISNMGDDFKAPKELPASFLIEKRRTIVDFTMK